MLVLIYEINFLFMTFRYICAQFPLTSHKALVEIKTFPCVLKYISIQFSISPNLLNVLPVPFCDVNNNILGM